MDRTVGEVTRFVGGSSNKESLVLSPLRVLIVDDAGSARRFPRAVLERCRDFDVVGEASDGDAAIQQTDTLRPDLVLLDLSMPTLDGASALKEMLKVSPETVVIVVSSINPSVSGMMLDAGATAFVSKGLSPIDLLDRLGGILGRECVVDASLSLEHGTQNDDLTAPYVEPSTRRAVVFQSDPSVRNQISQALKECGMEVVAETGTPSTALAIVDLAQPQVVVLELSYNTLIDTSTIADICSRSPRTVVVVYSKLETRRSETLAAGATVFVREPGIGELTDRVHQLTPSRSTMV